jgi:RNA polymerase sigma-70 factor, ECF subfamily
VGSDAIPFFHKSIARAADAVAQASRPEAETAGGNGTSIADVPDVSVQLTDEQTDEDLLLQIQRHSKNALAHLFRRHAALVQRIAVRVLRDPSEAEDLLQDLFVFIFNRASIFDPSKSSAKSWLVQMAYHRALDRRRYLTTRHHYQMNDLDEALVDHATVDIEQMAVDGIDGRALLANFHKQLTLEQQVTLRLHFFEGYSLKEIAEQSGQTLGNVRNHYYRGLARLRACVASQKAFSE